MALNFLGRNKYTVLYGICLALLLLLLQWLKLKLIVLNHAFEFYVGSIAVIFTGLGVWLALKLGSPKVTTVVVEKEVYKEVSDFAVNQAELTKLNLSKREIEVLQLMSRGMSNKEIAEQLFVSVSTIKTHSNNLFDKMEVKRRTQAIEKARKLGLIAA